MSENKIQLIQSEEFEIELLGKNRQINLQQLFTPEGIDSIINKIKEDVVEFSADVTTKEGQAQIKSMAAKVAKCKSPIENLAMELKEDSRKVIDDVNREWNRYKIAMDELRDKIRKPVDDIEDAEAKILKERQDRLSQIESFRNYESIQSGASEQGYQWCIDTVKELLIFEWEEFSFKAKTIGKEIIDILEKRLSAQIKYNSDQAEIAQLKKEKAEREQKDHEAAIAAEAARKAKFAAEMEAAKKAKKLADDLIAAKAKFEKEKQDLEESAKRQMIRSRIDSLRMLGLSLEANNFIFRNIIIEFDQLETLDPLNWEKLFNILSQKVAEIKEFEAQEETKKAIEEAAQKERERIAQEKRKENEMAVKCEVNRRHQAKINNEAAAAIQRYFDKNLLPNGNLLSMSESLAKMIVEAIAKGEIPNIKINY
jgi:colicin import membrane protein